MPVVALRVTLLAGLMASFASAAPAQEEKPLVGQRDFAVQADPKYAARINAWLEEVAEPIEIPVEAGQSLDGTFSRLCGIGTPPKAIVRDGGPRPVIVAPPCLRSSARATVEVVDHARLEALAVSLGLARSSAKQLEIVAADGGGSTVGEGQMKAGDTVVAPRKPQWTNITLKADQTPDVDVLLQRLAQGFPCDGKDAERCLFDLGILVAQREPPRPISLPPDLPEPAPSRAEPVGAALTAPRRLKQLVSMQEPVAAAPAPAAVPPPPKYPPIADAEWPYDRAKLMELFADIEAQRGPLTPGVVGVADVGMASWRGEPLPVTALSVNETDDPALPPPVPGLPNGEDDDEDTWRDDWYGAGTERDNILRDTDESKTGDIGLCRTPVDYSVWDPRAIRAASHGTMAASIAAGAGLNGDPSAAFGRAFPQILFYRLAGEFCHPKQLVSVGDVELTSAFDYLLPRANILSVSYLGTTSQPRNFTRRIQQVIWQQQKLLFIPAGNSPLVPNLDQPGAACPQCLAKSAGPELKSRLVVVGAATQDRRRARYSGYGLDAVKLYAPGEPVGALDVRGQPADPRDAGTSFATPYAAFAAALLESLGREIGGPSASAIRGRLRLSTWSLADDAFPDAGVVDLVKVAAALHNVVEVREFDGTKWVLRNYVGKVTAGLENICAKNLSASAYQAVRLFPEDDNGVRRVVRYKRDVNEVDSELLWNDGACRPSGHITLRLMNGKTKDLPLKDVSLVLLSWSPNWSLSAK